MSAASFDAALRDARDALWLNPGEDLAAPPGATLPSADDVRAASERFQRFAPLLAMRFAELRDTQGVIESALLPAPRLAAGLGLGPSHGRLWVKADHQLPVAGSVKARGGIHEVLEFAERLALQHGLLGRLQDDHRGLASEAARALYARHTVAVGSTGNLGLSIGIAAAGLGFRVVVHMSAEAKPWKKQRLRDRGVEVVEHRGDYESAVAHGRRAAAGDPLCHFVDDERSPLLFCGYAAAVFHLERQLAEQGIEVGARRPLFVYLPCGVGGAPGGIAFGLKLRFGPHVHCFFVEPDQSPCFLVGLVGHGAGRASLPSVYDAGLSNATEADGLAVPRASALAVGLMRTRVAGVATVSDERLFQDLRRAHDLEGLRIEPSAAAGFCGPGRLVGTDTGRAFLRRRGLLDALPQAHHVVWTTGGLYVPEIEFQRFLARAAEGE